MSKEYLEAFKNLKQELYYSPNQIPDIDKWHEIIEQALERLESIENAEPSEAIKHMEFICKILKEKGIDVKWVFKEDYTTIKQALLKLQELANENELLKAFIADCEKGDTPLKSALFREKKENAELKKKARAFEIIKEKRIDIESFYSSFIERDFNYDFYSSFYGSYGRDKLTKEEFNLLKEVLE